MARKSGLDESKVLDLLGKPFNFSAEESHPWRHSCDSSFSFPLLRTWDFYSGSQPDEHNNMDSRALDQRLDTVEARQATLRTHINHKSWVPTPYISFQSSPAAIEEMAERRKRKRGVQTLTAINPNIRVRNGLPILDFDAEMEYYKISNPYGDRDTYCVDHYLCLWQVTEKEIIGHWKWDKLYESANWYEEILIPAFQKSQQAHISDIEASNMSLLMEKLSLHGESTGKADYLESVSDTRSIRNRFHLEDVVETSEESCEEGFDFDDDSWDTDDEVEEANTNDDVIKMIEESR